MKIVQINAVYRYSSTGRNVMEMHKWLLKNGHSSYVFWATKNTSEEKDEFVYRIGSDIDQKIHALKTKIYGDYGFGSLSATKKLCAKLKEIKPDIVHLHNLHSNYINMEELFLFLKAEGVPVVITLHDCWFFTGGCMHYTQFHCNRWMDTCNDCPMSKHGIFLPKRILSQKQAMLTGVCKLGIIGVSNWIKGEAEKSVLKNAEQITYIYNWIDMSVFHPYGSDKQESKRDVPVLLFVSASWKTKYKGLDDVLYISEKFPDARIVIVGRETEMLEGRANIVRIPFTDSEAELAEIYSSADVFINPSRMETFGKVTAEALSCGTPIVVYRNTASKELCEDGCGETARDGDCNEMVEKIRIVLEKGKQFYTSKCTFSAKQRFSLENAMSAHMEFYQKLTSERKSNGM